MHKLKHITLIAAVSFLFSAETCNRKNKPAEKENAAATHQDTVKKDTSGIKGEGYYIALKYTKATVVDMRDLDGCQYLLRLENGNNLEPVEPLPESFRKNNLPVWVKYTEVPEGISICMAGQMVKITEIIPRE